MRLMKMHGDKVELEVSTNELVILDNALNEIVKTVHMPEFETRIGVARDTAAALLAELGTLLEQRDPHTNSD